MTKKREQELIAQQAKINELQGTERGHKTKLTEEGFMYIPVEGEKLPKFRKNRKIARGLKDAKGHGTSSEDSE